jgi:uncharacterized membrane protein YphA (DoxX/SURF4 family)
MRSRDAAGITLSSLILRLMLAVIFIHAGLSKIMTEQELPPEKAAQLANLGGLTPAKAKPATPTPAPKPDASTKPATDSPAAPLPEPTVPTPVKPEESAPATTPESKPDAPSSRSAASTTSGPLPALADTTLAQDTSTPGTSGAPAPAPQYTAADFPTNVKVKTGLTIALGLADGATPITREDGTKSIPLVPAKLAQKPWPVVLAWTATLTELIGGALLVIGLFTRLSALGISFTMLVAMWLTQIGPAIQSGNTALGFLPAYPAYSMDWMTLSFQFALFAAATAVLFLGPGAASLDAAIFGGGPAPAPMRKAKSIDED